MILLTADGGFDGTWKEGHNRPYFSEASLQKYWPNWLVKMTARYKAMCGCEVCVESEDLQENVNWKRQKLVNIGNEKLASMVEGEEKNAFALVINNYVDEIMVDGDLKNKRIWDAASCVGCNPIEIDGQHFPHFSCVLGDCQNCPGFKAPDYEWNCNEIITFCQFTSHYHCNIHGNIFLEYYKMKPFVRCSKCDSLSEEEKSTNKRKPKITKEKVQNKA